MTFFSTDPVPVGDSITIYEGVSLAAPNKALAAALEENAPGTGPYISLATISGREVTMGALHGGAAAALLGMLTAWWEVVEPRVPVDRRDQLQATRDEAAASWRRHVAGNRDLG